MMACNLGDFGCYAGEWFAQQIAPYTVYIIISFFAFIMLFFKKLRILGALILIGIVLWLFGVPTILPPIKSYFGM